MKFTENELNLLYAACMSYGNFLADTGKKLPNEDKIVDIIADRAKESYNLARKIVTLIEEVSEEE